MTTSEPLAYGLPGHTWTVKKVQQWARQVWGCVVSRTTVRQALRQAGLRWKKGQKVLKKADPVERAAYVQAFQAVYDRFCRGEIHLLYVDEAHFHQEMDLGYTWAVCGQPVWRLSHCPPLQARLDWYGAYDFGQGRCCIWHTGGCNGENTVQFLHHLRAWLGDDPRPTVIIWDGAPSHTARIVQQAAADLGFLLMPLPGYSPDLNPIEGLWKWMRTEVTYNHCHLSLNHLYQACQAFIDRINTDPDQVISRLWPKFDLDPEFENLLLSN